MSHSNKENEHPPTSFKGGLIPPKTITKIRAYTYIGGCKNNFFTKNTHFNKKLLLYLFRS